MNFVLADETDGGVNKEVEIDYIFNKYYSRLCYYAFKIINNQESAKDIVQDNFLKYWHTHQNFSGEVTIKNFLYLSVKNACLNYLRHEGVEKNFAKEAELQSIIEEEKAINHLIRAEVIGEIQKAIELLPNGCKSVIKLSFMEGLKNEEIALHLGISINTVKSQKQRALQLLRLKLDLKAFLLLTAILPV